MTIDETKRNVGGRPKKQQQLQQLLSPADLVKLQAEIYKRDFFEFFKACFELVTGNVYEPMWHVEKICYELQAAGLRLAKKKKRDKHYNVNVPPRSLKSVIMSVTFPVWIWLHNPTLKILSVSHTATLASSLLEDSARLMQSEWFTKLFGNELKLSKSNTEAYSNDKGGFRKAFGATGHFIGFTADLILLDDIMDSRDANSDTNRNNIIYNIRKDGFSRQDKKNISLIINIQQRLHTEDFSGWLIRNKSEEYIHIKLPAEAESADKVSPQSWYQHYTNGLLADLPGRLSRKDLVNVKVDVGSLAYAQMFLQEPVAPGGGMFKEEWFEKQIIDLSKWQLKAHSSRIEWQLFIDGAETTNPKNDPTCLFLCCKLDNQLYVKEVRWVRQEFFELIRTLETYLKQKEAEGTPVKRVLVEGKSTGKQIISVMRASACLIPFTELDHKFGRESKYARALTAQPFVEARKLWLISDATCKEAWNEKFIQEVTAFVDGKGKTHDDAVDTMAYAIKNAKAMKVGVF